MEEEAEGGDDAEEVRVGAIGGVRVWMDCAPAHGGHRWNDEWHEGERSCQDPQVGEGWCIGLQRKDKQCHKIKNVRTQ